MALIKKSIKGVRRLLEMQLDAIQQMEDLGFPLISGESHKDARDRVLVALDLLDATDDAPAG